jgi:hypothetical protein
VSHLRHLRITAALSATALVMAVAPSAQAATNTCNEARNGHTGVYVAVDGDPGTPARHQSNLAVLGSNKGLTNAAAKSPALSECVIVVPTPDITQIVAE